jgi:1-phosphofructokinase family hexose kinase
VIVAAGLSPAWQQIVRVPELRRGEVHRAREVHQCASGKVINVALALAHLQVETRVVALVGGEPGQRIQDELSQYPLDPRWVPSARPTRTCTTIVEDSGLTSELVEPAPPASPSELEEFALAFAQAAAGAKVVVLTGSLPAGAPPDFIRRLLAAADCPAVLDVRGPELLAALPLRPLVVKPNREELGRTLGLPLDSDDQLRSALGELTARGAQWAVVTQGAQAVWVASSTTCLLFTPPPVEVVNPIGSGDCLAAALAWGIEQGRSVEDALPDALAAAADNAAQLLPARLDRRRVARLASQVRRHKV